MQKTFILFSILAIVHSCSPRLESWYLTSEDVETMPIAFASRSSGQYSGPCNDELHYIPDTHYLDHSPIKYIRVNFHWMNTTDSASNWVGKQAIDFTHGLLKATNYDLGKNHKMWLPHHNDTPVLPIRYRYVLTPRPGDPDDDGIYFHFDDELTYYVHKGKNRNLHQRDAVQKYGVQLDTVLNIFVHPHHPDSVDSPTYLAGGVGVALGNAVKVAGFYEHPGDFWGFRGMVNHELGHILGLSHAWAYDDGCDDTPLHRQDCWNRNQRPGCDSTTSNNVMDYNAMQHAWTPCQIGRIQERLSRETFRARKFLQPNWCELHEDRTIVIRDSLTWNCRKDLEGHLIIDHGAALTMRCRTSLPKEAKIVVRPGGTLILDNCRLHNACGDEWQGIEIQKQGEIQGKVVYIGEPKLENVKNPLSAGLGEGE